MPGRCGGLESAVMSPSHFFRVADGLELHYRDYPGNPAAVPLLCLHGLTRNARDFAGFAESFSPARRVLALDFRGRGGSEWDPQPGRYVPPAYARDVLELLDQLGIARAVFVGTSLGGLVTMAIAALAPERIAAAILNDVGPEIEPGAIERIKSYVGTRANFPSWAKAAEAVRSNQRGLPVRYAPEAWEAMARRLCREEGQGIRFDYDPAIAVPFRAGGDVSAPDLWPVFDALAARSVLVVRGEHSDLLSAATLARMAERSPNVRTVTVPGAGHAPELDEPEAVAAIEALLASLDG